MPGQGDDLNDLLELVGTKTVQPKISPKEEKKGMANSTIIIVIILIVALLVAGVLAWRARNAAPAANNLSSMIAYCPDPERRLDLEECNTLLSYCKREWVKELLTRAIEMQSGQTPTPSSSSTPQPPRENTPIIHGGDDNDPLFD